MQGSPVDLLGGAFNRIDIAIPVRDEAVRLPRLLKALARAAAGVSLPVRAVIFANDCTDASADIARAFRDASLEVVAIEAECETSDASAGRARRLAMDIAAVPGGLLMTTDADAVPGTMWIRAACQSVQAGADLVCGAISAHAPHVLATRSGARITHAERRYSAIQHRIRHALDQLAGRQAIGALRPHYMESGASMAILADRYLQVGGLPRMDHSEDRALVYRAELHDLIVHYCPTMQARVSARLRGRAMGGMAACLRHRMQQDDPLADQAMLPVDLLHDLWSDAMAGRATRYPDRSVAQGRVLRASDLEKGLAALTQLYVGTVRPDLSHHVGHGAAMAAQ
ncbi:glycosyltransferase [Paracoccus hibiscisoli]|uniref:glycosyltransferase n=1 Tax=Paracoccus hibiscisoli TaxID=2023261 RepID=UPI0023F24113|nr:glycosyltransferase [Paracoccus hibiscisoli]